MKNRTLMLAAAAALALPSMAEVDAMRTVVRQEWSPMPSVAPLGKGKGRRPRHSSSRYVAQDKRDARKRRRT